MKNHPVYEIPLAYLGAWLLLRWKRMACAAAACAIVCAAIASLTFQAPAGSDPRYQQIESALLLRKQAQLQLDQGRRQLEENQLYQMDPQRILTKRLTLTVALEDSGSITDQLDPTDQVLFAYHNAAREALRGDVLVPELLTRLQQEQLFTVSYDPELNILSLTMTAEEEALADAVLSRCAQWYQAQQATVAMQTAPHTLTVLPLSQTFYTQAEREAMVDSTEEELRLQSLKETISQQNTLLDQLFRWSSGTAAGAYQEDLEQALACKRQSDAAPGPLIPLLCGLLGGLLLSALGCSLPVLLKNRLLGESGVSDFTGWPCIGRLKVLPPSRDAAVRLARRVLYRRPEHSPEQLEREVQAMTALLLADRGLPETAVLGILGSAQDAELLRLRRCLCDAGFRVEAASLSDRVAANALCRSAGALIFAGSANAVTEGDISELQRILEPLKKTPLGYVLL